MRILLQPSSGQQSLKHFDNTIRAGVLIESLRSKLPSKDFDRIYKLGEKYIRVWGFIPAPGNRPRQLWTSLQENDLVIFAVKGEFYFVSKVLSKVHNKSLALSLWGIDNENRTWEYICFLKGGKRIQIPYKPEVIGYKSNHAILGAILLDEDKTDLLSRYLEKYDSWTKFQ